jgi:hypothetical protein
MTNVSLKPKEALYEAGMITYEKYFGVFISSGGDGFSHNHTLCVP